MKKPTKGELAEMLMVTEEDFHRLVKPIIKKDFRDMLMLIGDKTSNPDIWLDDENRIILVHPLDSNKRVETGVSIFAYK